MNNIFGFDFYGCCSTMMDAFRLNGIYVSGLDKLSVTHLDGLASFVDPHTIRIAGTNNEDDTIIRGE